MLLFKVLDQLEDDYFVLADIEEEAIELVEDFIYQYMQDADDRVPAEDIQIVAGLDHLAPLLGVD